MTIFKHKNGKLYTVAENIQKYRPDDTRYVAHEYPPKLILNGIIRTNSLVDFVPVAER
jgi:hypothetical protein